MKRRVAVTGVGVVSTFGTTLDALWAGVSQGRSGVTLVESPDAPGATSAARVVGAPVTGYSARDYIDAKSIRLMAPAVTFGVAAAHLAAADSALAFDTVDPVRLGAFVGSRGHSSDRQDLVPAVRLATEHGKFSLHTYGEKGLPLVHPMWLLKGLANNVLYFVSLKFNAQGYNNNISMSGVAGTMAVGEAFHAVQRGYVDVALAGAYDSGLDVDRLEMFGISGLVTRAHKAEGAGRPFDRQRDGFVPGEGGGFVVLEALDAAERRGATIYGEVLGYGSAAHAATRDELGPSAAGFGDALSAALADAGLDSPDAVLGHGLATQASDAAETRGVKAALGKAAAHTPVSAPKSMIGNAYAASGVLEAAIGLAALRAGALPPTINLTEPDPACDLDYVPGHAARTMPLRTLALNNANLGGAHAALILGRTP